MTNLEYKKEDFRNAISRAFFANQRVFAGKYGYCDNQDEADGLSAGSCDDEMGAQQAELIAMADEATAFIIQDELETELFKKYATK